MSNAQTFQSAHSPENVRVVKAGEAPSWFSTYWDENSKTAVYCKTPDEWVEQCPIDQMSQSVTFESAWSKLSFEQKVRTYRSITAHSIDEAGDGILYIDHVEYLVARSIMPGYAAELGIVTLWDAQHLDNWAWRHGGNDGRDITDHNGNAPWARTVRTDDAFPMLAIPRYDVDGEPTGYQVRPASPWAGLDPKVDKPAKFRSAGSIRSDYNVHPEFMRLIGADVHEETGIVFTEGDGKAAALNSIGIPTVAAHGVWNFRTKITDRHGKTTGYELAPQLHRLPIKDTDCIIAYDADAWTNADVAAATRGLAEVLTELGAKSVSFAIPPRIDGDEKTGWDDWVTAGGDADRFLSLVTDEGPQPSMSTFPALHTLDREEPDEIPWHKVGGRKLWLSHEDGALTPQRVAEHFVRVAGGDWLLDSDTGKLYRFQGSAFVEDNDTLLRQDIRKYFEYRRVLMDAANGPSHSRSFFKIEEDGNGDLQAVSIPEKKFDAAIQADEAVYRRFRDTADAKENGFDGCVFDLITRHWGSGILDQFLDANKREPVVKDVRTDERITCRTSDLNADDMLIAFRDVVYDARTGDVRPHSRGDRITRFVDIDYPSKDADQYPAFQKALAALHDDPEERAKIVARLRLRLGSAPIGVTPDDDRGAWFLGKQHAGKSTLLDLITGALNPYLVPLPLTLLTSSNEADNNYLYALHSVKGQRCVVRDESGEAHHLAAATFKAFFSKGPKTSRGPYGGMEKWLPSYTAFFATNDMPTITGNLDGVQRRAEIYAFPYQYVGPERLAKEQEIAAKTGRETHYRLLDPTVLQELADESGTARPAALAAIWRFILDGVDELRARGWSYKGKDLEAYPASMQGALDRWMAAHDSAGKWIAEFVEFGKPTDEGKSRLFTTETDLYASYEKFMTSIGKKAPQLGTFLERLEDSAEWKAQVDAGVVYAGRRTLPSGKRTGRYGVRVTNLTKYPGIDY